MVVSGNPDVIKEAKGGDEHKRGGKVKAKSAGQMGGGKSRRRADRPGRRTGGRVGADKSPLSSAHKGSQPGGATPKSEDSYGGRPPD
jgi:hypothetical protein